MSIQISSLSHLSLLIIEGIDSRQFLQGQITCDTNNINKNQYQYAAHCTNKGRTIANFIAAVMEPESDDKSVAIALRTHASLKQTLHTSLAKYMVFSKAEIQPKSDFFRIFGLQGNAKQWLNQHYKIQFSDDNKHQIIQKSGAYFLALDSDRVECWIDQDNQEFNVICEQAEQDLTSNALDNWLLADTNNGIGWIRDSTSELFLPQMLNFDVADIAGIDFKKGCYTGQEIVARMHYKGKLKRRLQHFTIESNTTTGKLNISPAGKLYNQSSSQSIGDIVSVIEHNGIINILAVCSVIDTNDDNVFLSHNGAEHLKQSSLPYAITT
jgi:folate-binding protein YgfZ